MKTPIRIGLAILCLLCTQLYAQNPFYRLGSEQIDLRLEPSHISLGFTEEWSESLLKKVRELPGLEAFSLDQAIPGLPFAVLPTIAGTQESDISGLLEICRQIPWISYAHPTYQEVRLAEGTLGLSNQLVLKMREGTTEKEVLPVIQEMVNGQLERYPHQAHTWFLKLTDFENQDPLLVAEKLFQTRLFEYIEPDFLVKLERECVNDPMWPSQWGLFDIYDMYEYGMNLCCAWEISDGSDVTIAILDDGVDLVHPDLAANLIQGYDALYPWGHPFNMQGGYGMPIPGALANQDAHGTACAGIAAGDGDNGIGITGVAPRANIMPVRVTMHGAFNVASWIAMGIEWAWFNGADILSNSYKFVGLTGHSLITGSINNAQIFGRNGLGCIVVFATANSNSPFLPFPASLPSTLAVGAATPCAERKSPTSCDLNPWWGSNYGTGLEIMAPGVNIPTTDITGVDGYTTNDYVPFFAGTSAACPHIAGLAALMLSFNSTLHWQQVHDMLYSTTSKLGNYTYSPTPGLNYTWNNEVGYGFADACFTMHTMQDVYGDQRLANPSAMESPQIQVYPNPARDYVHLELPALEGEVEYTIEILNMKGQMESSQKRIQTVGDSPFKFQLKDLTPGIYLIKINSDLFQTVQKIQITP